MKMLPECFAGLAVGARFFAKAIILRKKFFSTNFCCCKGEILHERSPCSVCKKQKNRPF